MFFFFKKNLQKFIKLAIAVLYQGSVNSFVKLKFKKTTLGDKVGPITTIT